jgi:hypothetical protein
MKLELCRYFAGYKLLLFSNCPGNPVDMVGSLRFRSLSRAVVLW